MAIKSKEEILNSINALVGENADDNVLTIMEDVSDTLADFESQTKDATNWKEKYEQNDNEWRQKYKERFMEGSVNPEPEVDTPFDTEVGKQTPMSFEDLFTVKE